MPVVKMLPDVTESKGRYPVYEELRTARRALNRAWYAWLMTAPNPRLVAVEMLLMQGAIEQLYDRAAGRFVSDDRGTS